MFRTSFLAGFLSLAIMACAPTGGFGPRATADCVTEIHDHCVEVCTDEQALAVGFVAVYPFNHVKCVCKALEEKVRRLTI